MDSRYCITLAVVTGIGLCGCVRTEFTQKMEQSPGTSITTVDYQTKGKPSADAIVTAPDLRRILTELKWEGPSVKRFSGKRDDVPGGNDVYECSDTMRTNVCPKLTRSECFRAKWSTEYVVNSDLIGTRWDKVKPGIPVLLAWDQGMCHCAIDVDGKFLNVDASGKVRKKT